MPLAERLEWLANSLIEPPLTHTEALTRAPGVPFFNVMQGDVIRTSSAFALGVRQVEQSYMILTSTCDLEPERRTTALLFPLVPRLRSESEDSERLRNDLETFSTYKPTKYFYLPWIPGDSEDVLFNLVQFDPLCTCGNPEVNLAERRASLSFVGWRLFGAIARGVLVRDSPEEVAMRTPAA